MHNTPPDQSSRDIIKNNTGINIIVDAGAGSGKTSSLIGRMLQLIVTNRYKVHEIAAITFTRKAASELKKRFQIELERTAADLNSAVYAREALNNMEQCYIGTIHSFCAQLLRERPVEAGIDPDFKEADEAQDNLIQEKAWHSYLLDAYTQDPSLINGLTDLGISTADLKRCFNMLNTYSDVENIYSGQNKPDPKDTVKKVLDLCKEAKRYIPAKEPDKGYDKLQKSIISALKHERYFDLSNDASMINLLLLFNKINKPTYNRWSDKDHAKKYENEFTNLHEKHIKPVLDKWKEFCHFRIMKFLEPAVEHYNSYKTGQSILSFQDLLTKTALMLKKHKGIREYFSSKYKCLLVDEFQDTDPVQAEIIMYLTGEDRSEQNWTKLVPKPGSLFVVGDPKQSIYRFRRADIDIYNLIKEIIVKNGGKLINLTANFRSLNELGEWYNKEFSTLFPSADNKYQPACQRQHTVRSNMPNCESGIKILYNIIEGKKDDIVREDGKIIAQYIRWAVGNSILLCRENNTKSPARYSDFLIILYFKESMEVYSSTLEEFGIPVDISGKSSLSGSEELYELILLLKSLKDTNDPVALTAVLRGLFFGISDNELYQFKRASGAFNIYTPLPSCFPSEHKFSKAFSKLKEYNSWKHKYTPSVCIEKIIRDTGLLPHSLSFQDRKSRAGHILELIELLKEFELKGADLFSESVDFIENLISSGTEKELNVLYDEENVVRLMNLHKAKGLEAPVVFLANPAKKGRSNIDCHIKRTGDSAKGYFTVNRIKNYQSQEIAQPKSWEAYKEEEEKYMGAEKIRLLYVAATRAKNLLIISSHNNNKNNPWNTLLEKIPPDSKANKDYVPAPLSVSSSISQTGYEDIKNSLNTWISRASSPSYSLMVPADLTDKSIPASKGDTQAKGREWGSAVHKAIEMLVKAQKPNIDLIIKTVLKEHNLDISLSGDLKAIIDKFLISSQYESIKNAESVLSEVPFYLKIDKSHALYPEYGNNQNTEIYISGTIDLVIKDKSGYTVIDLKTTLIEDPKELKELADAYSPQVKAYCRAFEEITHEKVNTGEIWFIGKNICSYRVYNL